MSWNHEKFSMLLHKLKMNQFEAGEWLGASQKSIWNWSEGSIKPRKSKLAKIARLIAERTDIECAYAITGVMLSKNFKKYTIDKSQKVVFITYESHSETFDYKTTGLIEYIAENLSAIKSLSIYKCKTYIGVNNE
tara:strand:+ start:375 stop:779 length:405 start_codon:yes stop_codon:yes gene_type:complete